MAFISHDGVSLRYDRTGSGPAVLFIHGWTCNRTFWERQVHALRDRHTVITVDLRGHGESSRPRTGYTIRAMADDLEHLVRALAVPRIALVGWSMGGAVALELARRLGERTSALALVGSTPGGLTDRKNPNAFPPERVTQMKADMEADTRAFLRALAPDVFKEGAASPLFAWTVGQIQKTPPHVVQGAFEGILAFEARKDLAQIRVPTAVLHGRHDAILPLGGGEALQRGIKGARLVVFEQSGHAPFLEETEAFNAALAELLAR
jgi:non-heme chloroperoxidase